jgi:type I restriction enzyme M protein
VRLALQHQSSRAEKVKDWPWLGQAVLQPSRGFTGWVAPQLLSELLKRISEIPTDLEFDAFGRIYEYFLREFARSEGQKGGEYFTPTSLVVLITEIVEPFAGRLLDPASGSGGMYVQSARFVKAHRGNPAGDLAICGVEKTDETGRLCRMNLAIHGLEGRIFHGGDSNSYYLDPHDAVGAFDYVMANPPFNVNAVDMARLSGAVGPGRRFPFGTPSVDNANYLWIQLFYSSLNEKGRSGFVMANSASDARGSEQAIRQKLIEAKAVDVMVAVSPNMFYTVTLPCTLWFFDRGKEGTPRVDTVLFTGARLISVVWRDPSPITATSPGCARRPRSRRLKPRAGASTQAVMSAWRRGKTSTMRTSRSSWRSCRRSWRA